jgi:hypothetical protein
VGNTAPCSTSAVKRNSTRTMYWHGPVRRCSYITLSPACIPRRILGRPVGGDGLERAWWNRSRGRAQRAFPLIHAWQCTAHNEDTILDGTGKRDRIWVRVLRDSGSDLSAPDSFIQGLTRYIQAIRLA